MKISVIIITRNREKMLAGCLESLIKQTRMPDEVIVVDNASSDNTKEVIAYYSSRDQAKPESREVNNEAMKQLSNQTTDDSSRRARTITIETASKLPIRYIFEKQIGMPYAQNRGIKEASGDLLLFLDDDCVADKHWVENMIKAHKKYPNAWVIQGRTHSLPKERLCSLLIEFNRFISVRKNAKSKLPLKMHNFFSKNFRDEIKFSTCDGNNFSIETSYIKKHNLSFDENFYRGLDVDLGKQILEKNGLIMFCPEAMVGHFERSTLAQFLEQCWEIGRTEARIENKWKTPSFTKNTNMMRVKTLLYLPFFCKTLNQWRNLPMLLALFFLDRLYRFNGYFYEKRLISLAKQ